MKITKNIMIVKLCGLLLLTSQINADQMQSNPGPHQTTKTTTTPTVAPVVPSRNFPRLAPKPALPVMAKPFGMPGIVGFHNGSWTGTDYLGFLSHNIAVNVEILKADGVPAVTDVATLEGRVATILQKDKIIPHSNAIEGPPLPFLHVLIFIYPVEKDKFVVFSNIRLFEQIQVVRKDFKPAGYWQGITWETQDVITTTPAQLNAQLNVVVDKLATSFSERYSLYNNGDEAKSRVSFDVMQDVKKNNSSSQAESERISNPREENSVKTNSTIPSMDDNIENTSSFNSKN